MEMEQKLPLRSNSDVRVDQNRSHVFMSHPWIRLLLIAAAVKSILGLIILFLLLGISITVLTIGCHFRHPRNCPVEENLSFFLIIAGSVSVEWIILSIILSLITIVQKHIDSLVVVGFIILTALIIIITNLFLFVWVIFGSVWTLKAFRTVQYTDPVADTFCRRTLFQFTLGYLIMTNILFALQCWYRLCLVLFCSIPQQ